MKEKVFCYHCRVDHSPEVMGRHETTRGTRWRCLRSIAAARSSVDSRDAFGQTQSEANRAEAREIAVRTRQVRLNSPSTL